MLEIDYDEYNPGDDEQTFIKLKDRYNELIEIRKDVYRKYNLKCLDYNKIHVLQRLYKSIPTIYCITCRSVYQRVPFRHHLTTAKHHNNKHINSFEQYNKFLNEVNYRLINEINFMINNINRFE